MKGNEDANRLGHPVRLSRLCAAYKNPAGVWVAKVQPARQLMRSQGLHPPRGAPLSSFVPECQGAGQPALPTGHWVWNSWGEQSYWTA